MSLPLNALSTPAYPAELLFPDNVSRTDRKVDYERGGIGLNDPSQGLNYQNWRLRIDGNQVLVSVEPYESVETLLFTAAGITEASLAFDQNMRPAVAYIQAGQAKLYWYDSFLAAQTTTTLAAGITSVYLTMDDKRSVATQTNTNDILLFYCQAGQLFYCQQRERFAVNRFLANNTFGGAYILHAGMNAKNRVQIELG